MLFKKLSILFTCALISLASCTYKSIEVDLIIHNASVYTVNDAFEKVEAFAVKDGKIVELGAERAIMNKYSAKVTIDAEKKFVYPGFIDAHCHFLAYGMGLTNVDLVGTSSWDAVIQELIDYAETHPEGVIIGRGWDQNDWGQVDFPTNEKLNDLFPDRAVLLSRIDGHALIVNNRALEMANIIAGQTIDGGIIEMKNGKLTGILVDNAESLVASVFPKDSEGDLIKALLKAQENCLEVGLTTIDDAGLSRKNIEIIQRLQEKGELKMRVYAMISDNDKDLDYYFKKGPIKTDRLNVRSVKAYADGALGSRGASLLAPYSDKTSEWGFLVNSFDHFEELAKDCHDNGFQLNTHCIGDSANRLLTDIYATVLGGTNDLRWRIEHAQVVHDDDIEKFKDYSIIPSIQPTHATSDMYWAEERLGKERIHEAYPYKSLLKANGLVALGTDFPVEKIDPMLTFYAAVSRQDLEKYPEKGFLPEQRLSRIEALRGMTIWAAISNFEENEKGSLEVGKFADFVIMDTDLLNAGIDVLPNAKVIGTYIAGEELYRK